jgi:hypothetical protein
MGRSVEQLAPVSLALPGVAGACAALVGPTPFVIVGATVAALPLWSMLDMLRGDAGGHSLCPLGGERVGERERQRQQQRHTPSRGWQCGHRVNTASGIAAAIASYPAWFG